MAGVGQRAEERFIEAFISQLAVKAFNEAILFGLSRCDIVPINVSLLNPFKDRHAGELGSVVRNYCLWHASFSDYLVQLTRNPLTGQRCVRNKN
jgi:hypothetical protein